MNQSRLIVIGAAGLTAAAELAQAGHRVTILEKDPNYVGGIARTVHYRGYRFDIGGHRFFRQEQRGHRVVAISDFLMISCRSTVFLESTTAASSSTIH